MKIFYISPSNFPEEREPGGAKRHNLEVINGLSKNHCVIIFLNGNSRNIGYLKSHRVKFYTSGNLFGWIGIYWNLLVALLIEIFKNGKPDVIYAREVPYLFHTTLIPKFLSIPQIFEVNGFLPEAQPMLGEFKDWHFYPLIINEGLNYWLSDSIVSVSETARRRIIDFYNVDPAKIYRVGNGADTEEYHPMERDECRAKLDIPKDDFVLVFMGTFAPWSGIEELIDALEYLNGEIKNLRCLILSGEKDRDIIRKRSSKLDVDQLIDIRGYIPWKDLPDYLNCADVAVNPLKEENSSGDSLKTYEYLACGLPIVCSDVRELNEFIEEDGVGLSYESGDSRDLAQKILTLYEDEPRREKFSSVARNVAEREYDWSHRIDEIEGIIHSIV